MNDFNLVKMISEHYFNAITYRITCDHSATVFTKANINNGRFVCA